MSRFLKVSVVTLERWKRMLKRGESQVVWAEIEAFRARGGDP